jgi:hypothetical protein
MTTIVIKGAELWWAKLDNPVNPFNEQYPHWEVQIRTRDKDESKEWKDQGLHVTLKEDDDGTFYQCNLKRKAFTKDGKERPPVQVVDMQLMPVDRAIVGNGSVGNVQLDTYEYTQNGQKKTGFGIRAIQVERLVEYKGGPGLAFEAGGQTEIVVPEKVEEDSSDW